MTRLAGREVRPVTWQLVLAGTRWHGPFQCHLDAATRKSRACRSVLRLSDMNAVLSTGLEAFGTQLMSLLLAKNRFLHSNDPRSTAGPRANSREIGGALPT